MTVIVDANSITVSDVAVAGQSAYVYIAWASSSGGAGFTTTFDAALDYIAIKTTTTAIASPAASDFTGLWKNYKGMTGAQGDPGGDVNLWSIQEVPSGTKNGVNKSFTLAHNPVGTVIVKFNGVEYQNTVDYSHASTTLTLITFAPNDAEYDTFWVTYPY